MNKYIYQGHLSRKRFSQNFLHDHSIINAIVAAINPQYGQAMVEIGPGLGALTIPIVERVGFITAIELDHNLVSRLSRNTALQYKINILQKDAMSVDFTDLSSKRGKTLRIFSNLPYNISTPLMFHLFNYAHIIDDMHFMLQKEVAKRLIARPNSKTYGRLSIMAQYYCSIIPLLEVSRTSFRPVPKVDSILVRLVPHTKIPCPVRDLNKLTMLTNLAFNQRRKIIRNSLGKLFSTKELEEHGIDSMLRVENLSLEDYCRLANALCKIVP